MRLRFLLFLCLLLALVLAAQGCGGSSGTGPNEQEAASLLLAKPGVKYANCQRLENSELEFSCEFGSAHAEATNTNGLVEITLAKSGKDFSVEDCRTYGMELKAGVMPSSDRLCGLLH
jgi:hypothetical protein